MLIRKRIDLILKNIGDIENVKHLKLQEDHVDLGIKDKENVQLKNLQVIDQIDSALFKKDNVLSLKINETELREILIEHVKEGLADIHSTQTESRIIDTIFDFLASIFQPIVPAFAGSGILKGILLLLSQLGILSDGSGLYNVLAIASNGIFYFIPVMLAFTTSQYFGVNPFVGVLISFTLIHPDFIALFSSGAELDILSIPIVVIDYSSTVIPIILAIIMYAWLHRFLDKRLSGTFKTLLIPLLALTIIVPITVLIIGPVGYYSGELLANFVNLLIETNGFLTGIIMGGMWLIIIFTGLNWAINPIALSNLSAFGYDFIRPFTFASNFATWGIVIGIFFASRNKELKSFAGANIFTIAVSGSIEPTLFGILVKNRKYFIAQIVGGAVGGAYMGLTSVTANTFVFGSLITLTALVGEEPMNLINGLIGLVLATTVSAVIAFIINKGDERKNGVVMEAN